MSGTTYDGSTGALSKVARAYGKAFADATYQRAFALAALAFSSSVVIAFYAIRYATERASNAVSDLVLSNIPVLDLDGIFAVATLLLIAYIAFVLFARPSRIPFGWNALALFFVIRSGFITLTHIGPFPVPPPDGSWGALLGHFLFSSDLFFSAHTGTPFLMALIFWHRPGLRYLFLAWSVCMAAIVLLAHLHYSIDVASAYFITYSIFVLATTLFKGTYARFLEGEREASIMTT